MYFPGNSKKDSPMTVASGLVLSYIHTLDEHCFPWCLLVKILPIHFLQQLEILNLQMTPLLQGCFLWPPQKLPEMPVSLLLQGYFLWAPRKLPEIPVSLRLQGYFPWDGHKLPEIPASLLL